MTVRALTLAIVALAATAPTASAVELGAADDRNLSAGYRPGTLESMRDHGITRVRFVVYRGRDDTQTMHSIRAARSLELGAQVVLSAGPGFFDAPGPGFAAWAAAKARDLQALGVDRVSVLNEPDLLLPVEDRCDTLREVRDTLLSNRTVLRPMTGTRRVRRYRTVVRVRRRHGHRVRVRVRVAMTRRVLVKRHPHRYRRVALYRRVRVTRSVPEILVDSAQRVTYTAQAGCLAVNRARVAVAVWRDTIPAIRAAAPGVQVLVGETSPVTGVRTFVAETQRLGYPSADGWGHHPYYGAEAGLQNPDLAVREPVYWTEFGTPVRSHTNYPESLGVARDRWARAVATADRLGVRQLVAYGWWSTGVAWDTAAEDVLFTTSKG